MYEIVTFIGYVILLYFTVTYIIGVRVKLGAGIHVTLASFYLTISTILIPISGVPFIFSWLALVLVVVMSYITFKISVYKTPILWPLLHLTGSLYAGIIRVGIPQERIEVAQISAAYETVSKCLEKKTSLPKFDNVLQQTSVPLMFLEMLKTWIVSTTGSLDKRYLVHQPAYVRTAAYILGAVHEVDLQIHFDNLEWYCRTALEHAGYTYPSSEILTYNYPILLKHEFTAEIAKKGQLSFKSFMITGKMSTQQELQQMVNDWLDIANVPEPLTNANLKKYYTEASAF